MSTKKITLATVKAFIRKHAAELHIHCLSDFDGMIDCVSAIPGSKMRPVTPATTNLECTLGIAGAWFVGSSRDYFSPYDQAGFVGIEVSNSCGNFVLAIPAAKA